MSLLYQISYKVNLNRKTKIREVKSATLHPEAIFLYRVVSGVKGQKQKKEGNYRKINTLHKVIASRSVEDWKNRYK